MTAEHQKKLALKLEKQGLNSVSAEAWKEYLAGASANDKEAAAVWYRIGKLYQNDGNYANALDSFYRSESFAGIDGMSTELAMSVQECLEYLGKFSALRYELSNRTDMTKSSGKNGSIVKGDRVVAEIGPQKITESDLDRQIEHHIDRQLFQLASHLTEEERNKQKEDLLKQLTTPSQRRLLLNQLILEEILYRRSLESNMTDDPKVRDMLKSQRRSLLARMVIEKEFSDEIKITPVDVKTLYEAHKKEYMTPERVKIAHILFSNPTDAKKAHEKLKNGNNFEDTAKKMSMDEETRDNGGRIPGWINKGDSYIPGIGNSEDAMRIIFAAGTGQVASENIITDKGVHLIKVLEHEKERQKGFDEVKNDVFRSLRSQKERDVQLRLLDELKKQYDVVIHQTAFLDDEKGN